MPNKSGGSNEGGSKEPAPAEEGGDGGEGGEGEGDPDAQEEPSDQPTVPPEQPNRFLKPAKFMFQEQIDNDNIIKPLLSIMLETLFLFERVKGEPRSKEQVSQQSNGANGGGDGGEGDDAGADGEEGGEGKPSQEGSQMIDEPFVPMTKHEMELLELKDFIEPQYAPTIDKNNMLDALIQIRVPINRVTKIEQEELTQESKEEKKPGARMAGKKELERQKEEQAEQRRELR
jgi:hypothetical protein